MVLRKLQSEEEKLAFLKRMRIGTYVEFDLSTILPASSSFLATSAARRLLTVIVGE